MYGMSLEGVPGAHQRLRPTRPGAPRLSVTIEVGEPQLTANVVDDHHAALQYKLSAGDFHLERAPLRARLRMREAPSPETVIHPGLAAAGAICARWLGWEAFHGGAFVREGRAWSVLGVREAGKSSLLAQLHLMGVPVITDDVIVIDDGAVLAGPGSVDLRAGAAAHLGIGERLGTAVQAVEGVRERWRVALPPVPAEVPLAGWILPSWGDVTTVEPVPVAMRLPLLAANTALEQPPVDPVRFLDLSALPVLEWRRPRDWSQMEASTTQLLEHIDGLATSPR